MQIVPATGGRRLRQFVEFPYTRYRHDTRWVPPLRRLEHERFDRTRHPFYEHGEIAPLLAMKGTTVVGRIAAIDDALHNRTHGDNLAAFGHFEALDTDAAAVLLAAAEEWARARGRTALRGPLNSSLNESAGLLVEGFDRSPMVMMPFNPPAYAAYIEAAGFRKVKDLYAWGVDLTRGPGTLVSRFAARARARHGVEVRTGHARAYEAMGRHFGALYGRAWADNWAFVPPTAAEIHHFAAQLRLIADPELVLTALVGGEPAGFLVAVPDINQALAGTGGRLWPTGWWRLLRRRRLIDQGRLLLMGVVPEYRHLGVHAVMIEAAWTRAAGRYRRVELSWVLEDNVNVNALAESVGADRDKTYRIYQKPLA